LRLVENFRDIRDALARQTNLSIERRNQESVAGSFSGDAHVIAPRVHREYCRDGILVMDFIEGRRGYDPPGSPEHRQHLAARMQDAFYTMVYLHGRFHVDPHPGNLLFLPDGRLCLLDFGLVGKLTEQEKWELSGFYYACVRHEWAQASERFIGLFVATDEIGPLPSDPCFTAAITRVLQEHFRDRTGRWSTVGFVSAAAQLLRSRRLRMKPGMSLLILSLLTGEGYLQDVDPSIDIWANARRFVDRASPFIDQRVKARFDAAFRAPVTDGWRTRAHQSLVAPTHLDRFVLPSEYPLIVKTAQGAYLEDVEGRKYVDLSGGYGPHILGYGHPVVRAAVSEAVAERGVNALATVDEILLAELIVAALPGAESVIFANSGSEAIAMAFRLARAATGRQRVAKFEGHFHGQSDQGLVSAWFRFAGEEEQPTAVAGSAGALDEVVSNTMVLQQGSDRSLEAIRRNSRDLACVICEPMPSATCQIDAPFLRKLAQVCRECDVPLIFDEVVTGFRVGPSGVQGMIGVEPDLTCLGKIIGGGLPCGAVAGRRRLIDVAKSSGDPFLDIQSKAFVGGTFSGNAATCAAGRSVLSHLAGNPELYVQLAERTTWLRRSTLCAAANLDIPLKVSAAPGILSLGFSGRESRTVRERLNGGNFRANLALSYYMREAGVYLPELHTLMLSMAHDTPELLIIEDAFKRSFSAMKRDGFL
jgi:glutamate-1-semialdehyde 2,1-aminomutase